MSSVSVLELQSVPKSRRWTREEYYRAAEIGLFRPDERLELIEGEIFEKVSPQKTPHFAALRATASTLEEVFGDGYEVRQQSPLAIDDSSEPEPDILVVPGSWRDYQDHHPTAVETRLLAEISDSSLAFDRATKAALYARAGVSEYWIVNLIDRRLEVHRDPQPDGVYSAITSHEETGSIAALAAPDKPIRIYDLLPTKR